MKTMVFGRTGVRVSATGFGCLPIQRISQEEAGRLLFRAADAGVTFFDTARVYTDSERKVGLALSHVREKLFIATKTHAKTGDGLRVHLAESLALLKTDHIDLYQFHNPDFVPRPGGADGLYDAALKAQAEGKIRFIGITQHSLALAREAVESGLYDALQYPFNHLASDAEKALVRLCEEKNVGFIAMKALSGGLITDASIPFAFFSEYPNVVPIWGFQRMEEVEQVLSFSENPPLLDDAMLARIEKDCLELSGAFCRGCGYCMPCPVGIPIFNANRMAQMLTRSPVAGWLTDEWAAQMERIEQCTRCGACEKRCPYGLKPYETLPGHLAFYRSLRDAN